MKLSEMYLQSRLLRTETSQKKSSSNGNGFEMLMSTADKAAEKTTQQIVKNKSNTKKSTQKTDNYYEPRAKSNKPLETNNAPKSESSSETLNEKVKTENKQTDKAENNGEVKKDDTLQKTEELEKAENEMVEAVAKELDVSKETVMQILAQLNMSALELTDAENLGEFMREFYKVESKVELLSVDNIQETLKSLQNVVSDFADEAVLYAEQIELNKQAAMFTEEAMPETQIAANLADTVPLAEEMVETAVNQTVTQNDEQQDAVLPSEQPKTHGVKDAPKDLAPEQVVANTEETSQQQTQQQQTQQTQQTDFLNAAQKTSETPQTTETVDQPEGIIVNTTTLNTGAVAETAAKQTESLRNINTRDIINQIVEKMKVEIKSDNTQEIKMTLRPENLGDVSLKITTQNGIVTAHFIAENQRVKEVIESNFNQLRDSLQEQGVVISQLSVSVGQGNSERRMAQFNEGRAKSAGRINRILNDSEAVDGDNVSDTRVINENDVNKTNLDYSI